MPLHSRVYTTEAIVLRRTDFGEADRILTLFTPSYGKVRAIAKGARRTTSRLAGHLEPFTRTQLLLAPGRELGGALCPTCSRYAQRRISLPALKVLRLLQTAEWEALPRLRLDESLQDELEAVMQSSLRFHLDRDLKSWSFLKHV